MFPHIVDCVLAYKICQVAIKVPRVDNRLRGVVDGVSDHSGLVVGQASTRPCNLPDTPAMQKREFWANCMLTVHCRGHIRGCDCPSRGLAVVRPWKCDRIPSQQYRC